MVCKYKDIKYKCLNDIRTRSKTQCQEIENGGWHFGFIVGLDGKRNKMIDRPHPEYTQWLEGLEDAIKNNRDYRNRGYTYWIDNENLPKYLLDNKEKWKAQFRS